MRDEEDAAEEDRDTLEWDACVEVIAVIGRTADGALASGSGGYGEMYSLLASVSGCSYSNLEGSIRCCAAK